ncbi:kinetochore Sim4 complex subunit FTA2-domain-containing protein [Xylariaceae sp. FL0255]|nr:kinetochore Sim4 complex subunit FTA2-domain-containing protein [Xylariaceae sp. FL0255]
MYPTWPQSDEDLVPLPRCEGPKLNPFDFQGPQNILFLEHLGEGLHSHVFKVQIRRQIYALKLFRFTFDYNWLGPAKNADHSNHELMSAFYVYSEPFSCECRAFGRLQEAGHEELAIRCFGYVLLDEKNERALHSRFPDVGFEGDPELPNMPGMRSRFLGPDDQEPPIRGIVKEFGFETEEKEVQPAQLRKVLGDITRLQQLGIMRIDIAMCQLANDKISDFSTAITVPHYITTPELQPGLTDEMKIAMELETFRLAKDDFILFDEMVYGWNLEYAEEKGRISVHAFPGGCGCPPLRRYDFRNESARQRVYTFVDPRRYDWKRPATGIKKSRRKLRVKPPLWIYYCGDYDYLVDKLRTRYESGPVLRWDYRDGMIFPRL